MTLAEDQAELLKALIRNGVKFVVIGGVAAQLRGWSGATTDLDIAVAGEEENTTRINRALTEVGLSRTPEVGGLGTSFDTQYGRLEIVRRADGIGRYDIVPVMSRRCAEDRERATPAIYRRAARRPSDWGAKAQGGETLALALALVCRTSQQSIAR